MADEDLKRIDYTEWKKPVEIKRLHQIDKPRDLGLILLSDFILNFRGVIGLEFNWITGFIVVLGTAFIALGILGFRQKMKKVSEIP